MLKQFTGSDEYGETVTYPAGTSRIEPGQTPRSDIVMSWPTFTAAEAENGISRLYGGHHFEDANLDGRALGRQVGANAWAKSAQYFDGVS